MIAPELIDILACPTCKGAVEQDKNARALLCRSCGLAFPVRSHAGKALPVMLVEEADVIPDSLGSTAVASSVD
ncbi:MAG: Trm112 family protein [Desulfobulbaceae bacterium]|nr:Trm112 family protein [Desulfobulbaceae bacterium]